jgi:predicted dehydrogenase
MYNALLIGCGNIGAMYDWDNEHILTHAKAYFKSEKIKPSFYDLNQEQAQMVAGRYNGKVIDNIDIEIENTKFDIVSICSPTNTHFNLLSKVLKRNTSVIICEKPISTDYDELEQLREIYINSSSRVLVNYIRRFQPSYHKLSAILASFSESEVLTNVSIRYQRGFINNCSHALDLLQFLFQKNFDPKNFIITKKEYDHFKNDPTICGQGEWLNANLNILGLQNVKYSHFEIDLYFVNKKIQIRNAGNEIMFYYIDSNSSKFPALVNQKGLNMSNCISDYMMPVIEKSISLVNNNEIADNFIEALQLNQTILNILND